MDSIEEIKRSIKNRQKRMPTRTSNLGINKKSIFNYLNKTLVVTILVIATLIFSKTSTDNKLFIYTNLYEKTFKFAPINYYYKKYFGDVLPFQNIIVDTEKQVFNEKLAYKETSIYKNGVKLIVDENYLAPILESGIVVFIGEKENYGNTVIIQQTNGVDTWYGNVKSINVQMYEYVEKGKLLAETNGTELILAFQKDGKFLDYKTVLK